MRFVEVWISIKSRSWSIPWTSFI